ncbi:S4 domain-containing protein, partial [Mahella sp.]|uniref:S4 domain-containing protein n=1 Tax=Mahella sp. TaxID=2798721 RepID=UPI0025BDF9C3
MDEYTLYVSADEVDRRLDTFLAERFEQWTRSHIQNLIKNGNITVNGQHIKNGYKLKDGDVIKIDIPELRPIDIQPEDIPLNILYEDEDIIVINKPQGMVVHPA